MSSNIPYGLIEQIKDGKVVLFLGAGSVFDAKHPSDKRPPTGDQLANLIAEKFLGPEYLNKGLQYVSELAISERDLFTVQTFIAEIFREFKPGDHHLKIPTFLWHSIYTTNYDLLIEEVYDLTLNRQQVLATFVKNGERIQDKMIFSNSLSYNKLHGSITEINDPDLPLILTPDQYLDYRENRSRLFDRLKEVSFENPILFVGFSFADYDIRQVMKELNKGNSTRPRSYMIGPYITEAEQRLWDLKKISSIKMSFKDFMNELDSLISPNQRVLSSLKKNTNSHPIESRFCSGVGDPSPRLIDFLNRDVDYIHRNLGTKDTDPKEFYKGYFADWDPILKGYDVQRNLTDILLSEVFLIDEQDRVTGEELFLVKGNAGSGKTVLLHRLAWEAGITFEKLCLFHKSEISIEYNRISELYHLVKERIYLFIDNVVEKRDDIDYLLNKSKKDKIPITIICAERTNVWNVEGEKLLIHLTRAYTLGYLDNKEVVGLISLLDRYGSLGYLVNKSFEEQVSALSEKSGRELLVALYEATAGKPFSDIVMDEYKSIPGEEAQNLYLSICLFHRIGTFARAGNISRLHDISFSYFKEKLFQPLESVVYHHRNYRINDFVFTTRHQHIAELVFEQALVDQEARFQKYIAVISKLDIDYDSDFQVFTSITNAKTLMDSFKDVEKIRMIYSVASDNVGVQSFLLQQESIFEMKANGGSFERAEKLLNMASEVDPDNVYISHSRAVFFLRRAEKSSQDLMKRKYLMSAKEICKKIIDNKKNKSIGHAFHTLLQIYVMELKIFLEEGNRDLIEKKIRDFENTINLSMQLYPNESFLLEAESNFNDLIKNTPKALESLVQAFEYNKHSPYLATRLSNFYIESGNLPLGMKVLLESINLNPNNKDLNFLYAQLLLQSEPQNYIDHKHYFRKSFVKNDKRYSAQFWYARTLYLLGEDDFKEYFLYLSNAPLDYRIKKEARGIVLENGSEKIYEGTVMKLESSFGFVKQDFSGESIYFSRNRNSHELRFNSRIKFKKAFNYHGVVAMIE